MLSIWKAANLKAVYLYFSTLSVCAIVCSAEGSDSSMVIMDNGENVITSMENANSPRLVRHFGFALQNKKFKHYKRYGGTLEVPVTDACLLDRECRRDMLKIASEALDKGVGTRTEKSTRIEEGIRLAYEKIGKRSN